MAGFRTVSPHPGTRLKQLFEEKQVQINAAAGVLGVGRQALSKVLNGKADLTPDMATRVAKAFGEAEALKLSAMQASLDAERKAEQAKAIATRTHVGNYLGIRAHQFDAWAGQTSSRAALAVLLRRLVHATGTMLTKVDFPGFDNSQRHGWDGFVVTDSATPWIPRGRSGWEFGCDANPARKAEEDYEARSRTKTPAGDDAGDTANPNHKELTLEDRRDITFVFVTPRNWAGKDKWVKAKKADGIWKDVIVHDADSLEQWLEQSVPAQSWFAEVIGSLGTGTDGAATMDACWKRFADVCNPRISKMLFKGLLESTKSKLEAWLNQPPGTTFVVAADSISAGLAFVSCALEAAGPMKGRFYDRALLLETPNALQRAVKAAPDFIAVVANPSVEQISAGVQETHHLLVVRLHNSIAGEPDISINGIDDQTFREALSDMKLPEQDYQNYVRETAYSPTILRRRLSNIPEIKKPSWSNDSELGRLLVPFMLVGVWVSDTAGDKEVMRALSRATSYDDVERAMVRLLSIPETPVWSIGRVRGVTSKIDTLFGAKDAVTEQDLKDFFDIAELVLSEDDPALDLPEAEQWLANIKGKVRDHSAALRRGICETLVLLAVHGDFLFQKRLDVHVPQRVNKLIEKLLTPLDGRTWSSQKSDLPRYAEAAPEVFLRLLKTDLDSAEPKVHALMTPVDSNMFGSGCNRTGLLWALETLAWKPERLVEVTRLLARLAQVEINDNWANKPQASLEAIFRSWMPQTAANNEERNAVMELLCKEYPEVGWRVITAQFGNHHGVGMYSARPHWRDDANGAGQTAKTWKDVFAVSNKARELAITWPRHTAKTLGDLVERLSDLKDDDQNRVWEEVRRWTDANNDETAAHELRERIRKSAFTRRARVQKRVTEPMKDRAREAYERLEPKDTVTRHRWLFDNHWVEESSDELEDEKLDYNARNARMEALRKAALTEIISRAGFEGLLRLIALSGAEWTIGLGLADVVADADRESTLEALARQVSPPDEVKLLVVVGGFLAKLPEFDRQLLLAKLVAKFQNDGSEAAALRVLRAAPFRAETWTMLDLIDEGWARAYWQTVNPRWEDQGEAENNFMVDKLLAVSRPRVALHVLHMDFNKLESRRLASLIRAIATTNDEGAKYAPPRHQLADAFKSLRARPRTEVSTMELAQLEFMYAGALDFTDYGIPTLEEQIGADPNLFMHLIALVYKRHDGTEPDRPEWNLDPEARSASATTGYDVLRRLKRLPGTADDGTVDPQALLQWVHQVRDLATKYGRITSADHAIGEMFGRAPIGKDGIWPCEPVRIAFDATGSDRMAEGFHMGRYNSRGVHSRGPGGSQERAMAAEYSGWAKAVAFSYPFMAKALQDLAETYAREAVRHDTEASIRRQLSD